MDAIATLHSIKPDGMASEMRRICRPYSLSGIESRDVCNATVKRCDEFAIGRAAARWAHQSLSIAPQSNPCAKDRNTCIHRPAADITKVFLATNWGQARCGVPP